MAKVDQPSSGSLDRAKNRAARHARAQEELLDQLIKDINKGRIRTAELARIDIKSLPEGAKAKLLHLLAQQLRGQLPPSVAKGLLAGNLATEVLERLMQRLANASSAKLADRFGRAPSADAARDLATDKSVPQQALRWTQFVQKVLHVPGARTQTRTGIASPRGEGTAFIELAAAKPSHEAGPGLRSPKLVERTIADMSPAKRALLMKATFGTKLANKLERMGITDPLQFVRAGALPDGRADMALALKMPRARLLGLLMRAELLKLGPGRDGQLGIRPEHLGPLRQAGIAMLGSLAAIRTLSADEMAYIHMLLRKASGGFTKALKGGRRVSKRDLLHWTQAASRNPSEILLADVDERGPRFDRADAQELIQAWYMENLLWEQLANARRHQEDLERSHQERLHHDETERQQRRERDDEDDEPEWMDRLDADLEYDDQRVDNLMCFWITDFNLDPTQPASTRRMYVCIDPQSGAIIPQQIEASYTIGV